MGKTGRILGQRNKEAENSLLNISLSYKINLYYLKNFIRCDKHSLLKSSTQKNILKIEKSSNPFIIDAIIGR